MKVSIQNVLLVLAIAACASMLRGQTMVEAGLGAARAATTAAGANEAGKGIAGAFGNLDKALKPAKAEAGSTTTTIVSADAEAPKKIYEDISKAETGISYDDLVKRFGPPFKETSGDSGKRMLTYGRYGLTKVEVTDGKVTAINTVKQQGVFTLPGK